MLLWTLATHAQNQPLAGDYTLGPGDRIIITVFDEPDLSMDFRIDDTGRLNYPFIGELAIEGMTLMDLELTIADGLRGPYLVDPTVTVSITEYRPFFLSGEVANPGAIPYQPRLTVERAISLGGGFTERASRNRIEVIREDDPKGQAMPIQLSDLVRPGDIITVNQSFF